MSNKGIKFRVVASLLVVGAIPLLAIGGYNYTQSRALTLKSAENMMKDRAENIATKIDGWVDTNRRILLSIAKNTETHNFDPKKMQPILNAVKESTEWNSVVFISDTKGDHLARSDQKTGVNWSDKGVFQSLMKGQSFAVSPVLGADFGKPSVVAGVPLILTSETLKGEESVNAPLGLSNSIENKPLIIGAIGARADVTSISRFVEDAAGDAFVFAATADGKVISHPKTKFDNKIQNLSEMSEFKAAKEATGMFTFDKENQKMIGYSARTSNGWLVVYSLPEIEVMGPVHQLTKNGLILTSIALTLIGVIAWILASGIAGPIVRLTEVTNEMSKGNFTKDESINDIVGRKDEIGYLAESVLRMSNAVKMAMSMIKK